MVALLLCTNYLAMLNQSEIYNDSFIEVYLVLCVFMFTRNQPVLAAAMVALAFSIKAGGLLALPAVLGSIQLFYGLKKLIAAVSVIFLIHVILTLPFFVDEAAYALGFNKGAQTTVMEYLEQSKLYGGTGGMNRSAHNHYHTYLWKFLNLDYFENS